MQKWLPQNYDSVRDGPIASLGGYQAHIHSQGKLIYQRDWENNFFYFFFFTFPLGENEVFSSKWDSYKKDGKELVCSEGIHSSLSLLKGQL